MDTKFYGISHLPQLLREILPQARQGFVVQKFHAILNEHKIYRKNFRNLTHADRFYAGKILRRYKYFKIPPKRGAKAAKFEAPL